MNQKSYHLVLSHSYELNKGKTLLHFTFKRQRGAEKTRPNKNGQNSNCTRSKFKGKQALQIAADAASIHEPGSRWNSLIPEEPANQSSPRPLTCARFMVDCYEKHVSIQTDSNNFQIHWKVYSIDAWRTGQREQFKLPKQKALKHRCSPAAPQATSLSTNTKPHTVRKLSTTTHRTQKTRFTASKQTDDCLKTSD